MLGARRILLFGAVDPIPTITSGPVWADNTDGTVTVTWGTAVPSNSVVDYGLTSSYGLQESDAELVTSHSVTISGLDVETTYHFKVSSETPSGKSAESEDATGTVTNVFLSADFTGSVGTDLTDYTPEVGTGFDQDTQNGSGNHMILTGDGNTRAADAASGYNFYVSKDDSPGLYIQITQRMTLQDKDNFNGLAFQKFKTNGFDNGQFIYALLRGDPLAWVLDSHQSPRATSSSYALANGKTYDFRFRIDGPIKLQIKNITDAESSFTTLCTLRRNDLLNHVQTTPGAWPGVGRVALLQYGAGSTTPNTGGAWINNITAEEILPDSNVKAIVLLSDSIGAGLIGGSTSYSNSYIQKLLDYYQGAGSEPDVVVSNCAIQAQTLEDIAAYDAPKAAAFLNSSFSKNVVVIHAGGNDMAGNGDDVSAATAYSRLQSTLTALRAVCPAGTEYVVVRLTPRDPAVAGANFATRRSDFHTLLDSNYGTDGYTIAELGSSYMSDSDALDAAEFDDGVHPTVAVHALIGGTDLPATLDAILA